MANERTDTKGKTVKVRLVKSPIGFKDNQEVVVRATFAGLSSLTDPVSVARLRGKELNELTGAEA